MTTAPEASPSSRTPRSTWANVALLILLGVGGGFAGWWAGIPAGFMIGSMVLLLAVKLIGVKIDKAPGFIGETGNILLGTFAGALFDRDTLANLGGFLLPALAAMVGLILLGLLVGWALSRFGRIDLATCLFGLTPGGLAEMIAASRTVGADAAIVSVLQVLRFYVLILVAMLFVRWLAG